MNIFWQLHLWKEKLLSALNVGILDAREWQMFIAAAENACCFEMASDMSKRLQHYSRVLDFAETAEIRGKTIADSADMVNCVHNKTKRE